MFCDICNEEIRKQEELPEVKAECRLCNECFAFCIISKTPLPIYITK